MKPWTLTVDIFGRQVRGTFSGVTRDELLVIADQLEAILLGLA